jgi:glycerol-3-phosphate cytidylyltransferase-like family protein
MPIAPGGTSAATLAATALFSALLGYALAQQANSRQTPPASAPADVALDHEVGRRATEDDDAAADGLSSPPVTPPADALGARALHQPRIRVVRLYSAMSCDLYHYGHAGLLERGIGTLQRLLKEQQPAAAGEEVRVVMVVGICSDETVESYKRRPIQTLRERAAAMRSCRYCDEVIEDAPAVTDASFMELHKLDYVLTGDDYTDSSLAKWFPEAARRGVCVRTPYTTGISTSDIIRRCQQAEPVVQSNIHAAQ